MTKILIVPKGYLGDIVLTSPVLEALKLHDPGVHITVLTPPSCVNYVSQDPLVDDVISFERDGTHKGYQGLRRMAVTLAERGFDRAYSLHASPRTAWLLRLAGISDRVGYAGTFASLLYTRRVVKPLRYHEVVRNLEIVRNDLSEQLQHEIDALKRPGPIPLSTRFSLRVPAIAPEEISEPVHDVVSREGPYVVLSPGSAWATKRWSTKGFREVAVALMDRGFRIVVIGARDDAEVCREVSEGIQESERGPLNMCGRTSVLELVHVIQRSEGVICNDSLAMHIASAVQVPTVAIFCATSPLFGFGPWKNRAAVVEKGDLFCKPCRRHGSERCPTGTRACMEQLPSESVVRAFTDLSSEKLRRSGQQSIHLISS